MSHTCTGITAAVYSPNTISILSISHYSSALGAVQHNIRHSKFEIKSMLVILPSGMRKGNYTESAAGKLARKYITRDPLQAACPGKKGP